MDRGAWWAAARRVAKSGTRLKPLSWQARAEGRQHKKEEKFGVQAIDPGCLAASSQAIRRHRLRARTSASDAGPLSPEPPVWTTHSPFSGGALPVAACHHGRCQRTALWTPLLPCRHLRRYLELQGLCLFQTAPSEWSFMPVEVTLLSPQTTFQQPGGGRESPAPPSTPARGWHQPRQGAGWLSFIIIRVRKLFSSF